MSSTIAKHYTRLLAFWPKDPLRPNLPFTRTIEQRAIPFGVKPVSPAPEPENASAPSKPVAPSPSTDTRLEQANINALFSLLENRYSKKYPISPGVLKPTSNPDYYDKLMEEIKNAPTKSWLQAKLDEWKMKIRFR